MKKVIRAAAVITALFSVAYMVYKLCEGRYFTAPTHYGKEDENELDSLEDDMYGETDD